MKNQTLEELKTIYKEAMARLDGPSANLVWEDKHQYGHWLAQMYYFLCHATRLLSASAARLTIENDDIHMRMINHCQQEKTHERQALRDLKALGLSHTEFPEHPGAAIMYQSQYYLIDYEDPCALFGCILYLEGYSLHGLQDGYKRSKKAFGDKATLFLRTHTQEDEEHIDQAFEVMSKCNEKQLRSIIWSFKICDFAYVEMMKYIVEQANKASQSFSKAA